ncbi:Piso0_002733 [Millerozyma farinosa CBS 7064]|uniref:Piso0_002733 protein n=1 Tax=Pichia sorbitophila (strain ATCC MYA-4447 / BCRC 22081 / CBS 7064 / NBRC 10061 / NRRL Y-12695) TaxID=559304 RepID=G8YDD2_PICSO|nr:Piso0_002733 [Millerozyma farinosa CBS 7064]
MPSNELDHLEVPNPSSEGKRNIFRFIYNKVIADLAVEVTTSEPRDIAQAERTSMAFIKFGSTLFFSALAIALNFRLDTAADGDRGNRGLSLYSTVTSYILMALALAVMIISGGSYYTTIQQYANHKIRTNSFTSIIPVVCVTFIVLTLIAVDIALIVEGYTS